MMVTTDHDPRLEARLKDHTNDPPLNLAAVTPRLPRKGLSKSAPDPQDWSKAISRKNSSTRASFVMITTDTRRPAPRGSS